MTTRRLKIWTGLGTYVIAGAGLSTGVPALAETGFLPPQYAEATKPDDQPHQNAAPPDAAPWGEQGGERGATAAAPPDEAFLLQLLLMKGHLRVGRELVDQGLWNDALPHFLHPTEEIYKELAPALNERKVAPFDKDLAALAALVKSRNEAGGVLAAHAAVLAKIEAATGALSAETRARPAFVFAVAERLLDVAVSEYKAALEGERVANPVEYQDSRGFVWAAEELVMALAPAMKAKDAQAFAALESSFTALKRAWPAVVPGTGAATPLAEVQANASRVVLAMSRLR
jgi:hypothetical protein